MQMNMSVLRCIKLLGVHIDTFAAEVEALEVCYVYEHCRRGTTDDVSTTV